MSAPLWQPSRERVEAANLSAFTRFTERSWGVSLPDYAALHRFSVEDRERFWRSIYDFCQVIGDGPGEVVLRDGDRMPGARWFPEARLNFAENLLRRRDPTPALIFRDEDGARRELSHAELYALVSRLRQWLRDLGVAPGDRVAGFLPNAPEAVVAMLATTSLGATWSSCSPDFGVRGVVDRFGQIEPRVLFCADGYRYGGKTHDSLERVAGIRAGIPSIEAVVVVDHLERGAGPPPPGTVGLDEALAPYREEPIVFERFPFDHPLYVLPCTVRLATPLAAGV